MALIPQSDRQVSTPGRTCDVCGHYMLVAPFRNEQITTVHLPSGKHTYKIRRGL